MAAAYDIVPCPEYRAVRLTLRGFWGPFTIATFARDVDNAVIGLRCGRGRHLTLVDATEFLVQSRLVLAAVETYIRRAPNKPERMAIVVSSILLKNQSKRVIDPERAAIFDNLADAEEWLGLPCTARLALCA